MELLLRLARQKGAADEFGSGTINSRVPDISIIRTHTLSLSRIHPELNIIRATTTYHMLYNIKMRKVQLG